jgi:hypothetical protein
MMNVHSRTVLATLASVHTRSKPRRRHGYAYFQIVANTREKHLQVAPSTGHAQLIQPGLGLEYSSLVTERRF